MIDDKINSLSCQYDTIRRKIRGGGRPPGPPRPRGSFSVSPQAAPLLPVAVSFCYFIYFSAPARNQGRHVITGGSGLGITPARRMMRSHLNTNNEILKDFQSPMAKCLDSFKTSLVVFSFFLKEKVHGGKASRRCTVSTF